MKPEEKINQEIQQQEFSKVRVKIKERLNWDNEGIVKYMMWE